jgi:hypothetical protein
MLYTIMPIEMVFGAEQSVGQNGVDGTVRVPVAAELQGIGVLCHPMPDGSARVERLLSTDPADFLRPELSPGEVVYGLRMKVGR